MSTFYLFTTSKFYFVDIEMKFSIYQSQFIANYCFVVHCNSSISFYFKGNWICCNITCRNVDFLQCISVSCNQLTNNIITGIICFPACYYISIIIFYRNLKLCILYWISFIIDFVDSYCGWSIDYIIIANSLCSNISIYFILCYGVFNFLSFFVFRLICKFPFPVICLCYSLGSNQFFICIKINSDSFWSDVCIAIVIPGLGSFDIYSFWSVTICYSNIPVSYLSCYFIIFYRIPNFIKDYLVFTFSNFFYCIIDCNSRCILCKIRPAMFPLISTVQFHRISHWIFTSIQLYLNLVRTGIIPVISILPFLLYTYTCFFRLVAVRNG